MDESSSFSSSFCFFPSIAVVADSLPFMKQSPSSSSSSCSFFPSIAVVADSFTFMKQSSSVFCLFTSIAVVADSPKDSSFSPFFSFFPDSSNPIEESSSFCFSSSSLSSTSLFSSLFPPQTLLQYIGVLALGTDFFCNNFFFTPPPSLVLFRQ
ncbi:unnamed protein product [Meloidogyne enterolobii]|uniref:Uncharacterized protein n=1 Tax=Meloidogyne enterolobii TaxID=390850 RepID=A0ACB0ZG56_MELEN